ncbi:hypothetical protein ACTFIU_006849 [Dictyostelium citrinum]
MKLIILLIFLLINSTFGDLQLTRYISNSGNDKNNCGNSTYPCQTIDYSIQQIKSLGFKQYSIEMLLNPGDYYSQNPINLYGLNITISANNPSDLVQLMVPNINNSVSPFFIVQYPYKTTNISPTNLLIKDVTVSGCNSKNISDLGYFFQSYVSEYVFLNVDIENVNFLCESLHSPYFSLSINSRITGEPYDNLEKYTRLLKDTSKSLQIGDNNQDLKMTEVTQYFYGEQYPNDNINITFTFNNCNFGTNYSTVVNTLAPIVLNLDADFIVDLTFSNTIFNSFYIYNGSPIAYIPAGSLTMNNVSIINITYFKGYSFFISVSNARFLMNQVNISGNFDPSKSIIYADNSLLNANQFNVDLYYKNGVTMDVIMLNNCFASFENSTIDLYVSSDFNTKEEYGNVGLFNPQQSDLYLFSNRIFSNGTSIINTQSSSVWSNNNQFQYAPSSTNNFQLVVCNKAQSNFNGDSSFINLANSCQTPSDTAKQWNELRDILLSFFCGVLSMFFIFLFGFIISSIVKCRKMKKITTINESSSLKLLV